MKPQIRFRAMTPEDCELFTQLTSYWPGVQFNGIAAYQYKVVPGPLRGTVEEVLMGMVGFDSWAPRTVMAHWAIRHPRCIAPLWQEAITYIAQTGRKSMLGCTPSDNTRAIKTIRHLGWEELYRIKDAWDEGVDLVISEYKIHVATVSAATAVQRPTADAASATDAA